MTCFIAANLDEPILAMLDDFDFENPLHDAWSGEICKYIRNRPQFLTIHRNKIATFFKRLPEMIVGSPGKSPSMIRRDAHNWFSFFSRHDITKEAWVATMNQLILRTEKSSQAVKEAVVLGTPSSFWLLPGLRNGDFGNQSESLGYRFPDTYVYLAVFAPPNPLRALPLRENPAVDLTNSSGRPVFDHIDKTHLILTGSPWSLSLRGFRDHARRKAKTQANLRRLLASNPDRTLMYDLLVTTGDIDCPEPEVKLAAEQRMAKVHEGNALHPAAQIYAFYRQLANGMAPDQAQVVLGGLDQFLIKDRKQVLGIIGSQLKFDRERAFKPSPYARVEKAMNLAPDL
jgi:hypothetical protein